MIFATVFLGSSIINEEIVRKGFAKVQSGRRDVDQISIYIKGLNEAEEEAIQKKRGIHSKKDFIKIEAYTDYTRKESAKKAQTFFNYIKNEKEVNGVVELVLNGSRFKIRIDAFKCFMIVKLQGIKTLQFDKNYPDYEKFSNLSFNFAK